MAEPDALETATLPLAGGAERRERRDAAANRERILAAAQRLFAERGVANVSMDEVAELAQVGKGTLYRRFGDRAGLAMALLDDRERRFQDAFMRGPPPLGPGAPPLERLCAFFEALAEQLAAGAELVLDSEMGGPAARLSRNVYAVHHAHAMTLLRELDPDLDAAYLAHVLLAPWSAGLYLHLRDREGIAAERMTDGMRALIAGLATGGGA